MISGTVIEYHRECYTVALDESKEAVQAKPRFWEASEDERLRQELSKEGAAVFAQQVAVGDRVQLDEPTPGQYVIKEVEKRVSALARKGTKRFMYMYQLVAANADQLAVVAAWPRITLTFIDRCFLAARVGGLKPLLIVNKLDIDPEYPKRRQTAQYEELGYRVHYTSALEGNGLDSLAEELAGRSTVFNGLSGVGKSTLIRALTGEDVKVGAVRKTGTGKQTTVSTRLYDLPGGGSVIDTPGIRVFGLAGLSAKDLAEYFSDISELSRCCKFSDCTHSHEPDCAVRLAIQRDELPAERLESYQKLLNECENRHCERAWN